jgi:hypothetical protein
MRRLYDDLLVGGFQRLSAAQILCDLNQIAAGRKIPTPGACAGGFAFSSIGNLAGQFTARKH